MQLSYSRVRTVLLSFVGGYVDTLGFIALFGLFTAHITGNFVLIGSMIVHPSSGVILKLFALPAFVLAVACTRIIILSYDRRQRSPLRVLYAAETLFLMAFMAAGLLGQPIESDTDLAPILAGILGAIAMGMQHTASGSTLSPLVPTTVMTGNVTNLIIDIVDIFHSRNDKLKALATERVGKLLPAVVAFGIGALCAGFAYLHYSFWALCLPILILVGLAYKAPCPAH